MDWVPILSQVKSAVLLAKGKKEAASETQKRFTGMFVAVMDHVPIVSQAKSIAQLMKGRKRRAIKIQENFIKTPLAHLVPLISNLRKGKKVKSLKDLEFEAGDVIYCRFPGTKGLFCHHVVLATSSTTVAHCVQVSSDQAELRDEPWEKVLSDVGFTKGFVNRNFCDHSFLNRVTRPLKYPGKSAVERALADIERLKSQRVYYDLFLCNCEHWVSLWVSGEALSDQAYLLGNCGKTGPKSPI